MTDETIVAVYDTLAHAEAAIADLRAAHVPEAAISQHAEAITTGTAAAPVREQGFWSSLFGGEPDHDTALYDRSMAGGSTVVSVKTPQDRVAVVTAILERHHPVDLDDRAADYGLKPVAAVAPAPMAAASTFAAPAATIASDGTISLAAERLDVGKRVVNRGGTRIRRFVVETPVEEQVTLRDERVIVDRRPVTDGRPVGNPDFTDKTIEMTETTEEAVIAKTAHVTEEISLRKAATERVETVRETVRREEVAIEAIPGETTTTTTTTPSLPLGRDR